MLKIATILTCLIVLTAAAAINKPHHPAAHPKYKFKFEVNNPHTGDYKGQWEHWDGDRVVGAYMLREPDGTHRAVNYRSSKGIGFQAFVNRRGTAQHPHHGQSYSNIHQLH